MERELSALHSGLETPERGSVLVGLVPFPVEKKTKTKNLPPPLNTHPDQVAETQFSMQAKTPGEKPKNLHC